MQRVLLANVAPTPWKNHRGTTQELLAWPEADNWHVRLSVATIDRGGEFSSFAGVTRWFAVIDGEGVELAVGDQQARVDTKSDSLCFDGGAPCHARLIEGKVRAFNVMFAKGTNGRAARAGAGASFVLDANSFFGVYSVGRCSCEIGATLLELEPGELLWGANSLSATTSLMVHQGQCVVVMGNLPG